MNTRMRVVVIAANVNRRQTRLLFVITAPGARTQAAPSQYCTSNARNPNSVNVVVGVGSIGAVYESCSENTFTSSIDMGPANATSIQSGPALSVPSFQPPPAPQPRPRRSPLIAPDGG
jgi:hypothetical protein